MSKGLLGHLLQVDVESDAVVLEPPGDGRRLPPRGLVAVDGHEPRVRLVRQGQVSVLPGRPLAGVANLASGHEHGFRNL